MDNQNTSAEDLWGDILEALFALDYSQVNEINEIEQQIYQNLQQNPQSVEGLITLMFAELMLGNHTRAVDIGNKIWGIELQDIIFSLETYNGLLISNVNASKA